MTLLELCLTLYGWTTVFTSGWGLVNNREIFVWGDLQLKTDLEGNRFVEFSKERQTKTRTSKNPRNLREKKPQMYENKNNPDRCPINTYLAYKNHRPADMMTDESPFYLAVNFESPKPGQKWFKVAYYSFLEWKKALNQT